ncbi:hypothetical protein CsatB_003691 [Cannabis sativa]
MAIAANFSGIVAPRNTWGRKPTPKTAIESFAVKTTCRFDQDRLKREHLKFLRNAELSKLLINGHNKFYPIMASNRSTNNYHNSDPASTSPSDLIKDFYVCINEKNMRKLGDYISADCYIEECSFPSPIDGKEEVFRFFKRLSTSMGENVKFNVQHVCQEDDQLIAAAKWHMEWKKSQIPFTRGCSFFECAQEGDKLRITKARIVIESPLKPGGYVLHYVGTLHKPSSEKLLTPLELRYFTTKLRFSICAPNSKALPQVVVTQSSLPSRVDQVSIKDSTMKGPRTGGSGGGRLKMAIGFSGFSFNVPPEEVTSFPCFFVAVDDKVPVTINKCIYIIVGANENAFDPNMNDLA